MTQLYLSNLGLSHFRSHRRAVIDVDVRPVAIYGPNGAGKTNIIEAISLLSPGRGGRCAANQDRRQSCRADRARSDRAGALVDPRDGPAVD